GAVANSFLRECQSESLGTGVERREVREVTARGAAYRGGLAGDYRERREELQGAAVIERGFRPGVETTERNY
ncbi:glycerol kinase, partial [Salmonella enterica]